MFENSIRIPDSMNGVEQSIILEIFKKLTTYDAEIKGNVVRLYVE